VAGQLAELDSELEAAKAKLSVDNLTGDELTQRVRERTGIERKPATRAVGVVRLSGTGTIQEGDLFETAGGVQFRATETKVIEGSGEVNVEAVVPGSGGNVPAGTITLFPVTLAGFTAVTNEAPTQDGFDEESDADLLQRYYERLRQPATSGNRAQYLSWAKEVPGVGDARVVPLWNGPNTVKVIVIDSDRQPASPTIVDAVQEHIDPESSGLGEGVAPIGAVVTVVSANGLTVDVSVDVVPAPGYMKEQVEVNIEASLIEFFRSIAFRESIVSIARVGAAILAAEGVADYSNLKINNDTQNITIADDEVAVLGDLTLTFPGDSA
jgi:uncharacterized phage protein gp47/JayE